MVLWNWFLFLKYPGPITLDNPACSGQYSTGDCDRYSNENIMVNNIVEIEISEVHKAS